MKVEVPTSTSYVIHQFAGGLVLVLLSMGVLLLRVSSAHAEAAVSREEAYRLVEDLIIEGRYGGYLMGPAEKGKPRGLRFFPSVVNDEPFDPSKLRHDGATGWNGYLIYLQDLRDQALFGLFSGGGWEMSGALVDIVQQEAETLELIKLGVVRWHNGVFDNYYLYKEQVWHFYLVRRDKASRRATIVKKWTFGHGDAVFFTPEGASGFKTSHIEGYLSYARKMKEAKVIIKGLNREFQEVIKVH